jgi:hypothetical protein
MVWYRIISTHALSFLLTESVATFPFDVALVKEMDVIMLKMTMVTFFLPPKLKMNLRSQKWL